MEGIRRVLLADTGEEFRDGFAAAVENEPDIQIVGQTGDGAELLRLTQSLQPDVIVMEMVLTSLDGLEVLDGLAKLEHRPRVVILSSYIRGNVAEIAGAKGADYYLTKPFEPKELLACVRMLTRRQPEQRASQNLEYGDLRLETDTFQLSCGERSVRLSRKEFDMLELLMRSREMVLTKENLILKLWGYESDAEDNNVEVYISFLRKKLDYLHSKVKIRTIRMVGYRLEQET